MRRATECFSWYSLMSIRTIARGSSNRNSASDRASSVLPTPVGPEEQERPDRPVGVGQAGPGPADGVGHGDHRLVLADDPLVEDLLHAEELGHLAFHQPGDGHARPLADDLGDVLGVDLLLEHGLAALELGEVLGRLLDPALELGDLAVADLGRLLEVGLPLDLAAAGLQLLLEARRWR